MGCDVHAHIEVKILGKWQHYNHLNIMRNYELFDFMAGVRSYESKVVPLAKDRGIPDDISVLTEFDLADWGEDAHSMTWLNIEEIAKVQLYLEEYYAGIKKDDDHGRNWYEQTYQLGYLFGNTYNGFKEYSEDRPDWLEDARMIMWFDN